MFTNILGIAQLTDCFGRVPVNRIEKEHKIMPLAVEMVRFSFIAKVVISISQKTLIISGLWLD